MTDNPLPPWILMNALQDTVHETTGITKVVKFKRKEIKMTEIKDETKHED